LASLRPQPLLVCAFALALGAAGSACVPGYDACFIPASIVSDVRVLAVRADPPEALYDLSRGEVEPVLVRALIAGQVRGARLQLRASLCVPGPTPACPDSAPAFEGDLTEANATEASLEVRAPQALIAQARDADPLKGFGGVRLLLVVDASADDLHVKATKTLLFSPRATTPRPNRALELEAVDLLRDGVLDQRVSPDGTAVLFVPISYGVRPRIAAQADGSPGLEEFDTVDLQGRNVHLREQATYSFFTDPQLIFGDLRVVAGNPIGAYSVGADEASEPTEGVPEPAKGLVRITPLDTADAHLWVVARDSRGAVAWAVLKARALDERICDRGDGVPCAAGKKCCPALFFGCN
jgi:hypothetical protein